MQVVVNSLLTAYRHVTPTGTSRPATAGPILILHGWGDSSAGWTTFADTLGADAYILDLPGFGGSEAPHEDWDLGSYASFVSSFLRKINIKPSAIIGHSNGGAIAIKGLADGSLTAHRLVLLASAGVRTEGQGRKLMIRRIAKIGKRVSAPLPRSTRAALRRALYRRVGSDMLVAEHMEGTFKRVVGQDVQEDARKLTLPVLLVYGEFDEDTPVRYGEILHSHIRNSELKTVSAGHFLHHDQAGQVSGLVKDFIA